MTALFSAVQTLPGLIAAAVLAASLAGNLWLASSRAECKLLLSQHREGATDLRAVIDIQKGAAHAPADRNHELLRSRGVQ